MNTQPQYLRHVRVLLVFGAALALCLLLYAKAGAVPAFPGPVEASQPDGTPISYYVHGDEDFHYITDADGYVMQQREDGYYVYLTQDTQNSAPSRGPVFSESGQTRPANAVTADALDRPEPQQRGNLGRLMDNLQESGAKQSPAFFSSEPQPTVNKLLTIMVEFSNVTLSDNYDAQFWHDKFYSTTQDSVNSYYQEVSGGLQQFAPAEESYDSWGTANDGLVRVKLSRVHPQPELPANEKQRSTLLQQLVHDAVIAADPYVDFAAYDTNGNGYIESTELMISLIVAGYETSYGGVTENAVWAHQWSVNHADYRISCDGVGLLLSGTLGSQPIEGTYIMMGELWKSSTKIKPLNIGVLCHELGHVLGLPDLYDTRDQNGAPDPVVGYASLMAEGSWGGFNYDTIGSKPVHLDAFSKILLGWVNPVDLKMGDTDSYAVNTFDLGGNTVYRIATADPNEFFIVENRQFTGFDVGMQYALKSGGIAIWHIDMDTIETYWSNNLINTNGNEGWMVEMCGLDLTDTTRPWAKDFLWYRQLGRYHSLSKGSRSSSALHTPYQDTTDSGVTINILSDTAKTMYFSLIPNQYELLVKCSGDAFNVQLINNTDSSVTAQPILAVYDSNGILLEAKAANAITADANATSEAASIPCAIQPGKQYRFFMWDSFAGVKPLTASLAYDSSL